MFCLSARVTTREPVNDFHEIIYWEILLSLLSCFNCYKMW